MFNPFRTFCVYLIKIILSATSPGTVALRRMSFLNSRVSIKSSSGALVIIIIYIYYTVYRCSVYIEHSKRDFVRPKEEINYYHRR